VTSLCLCTCMQPCLPLAFVDDALRNTVLSVNELLLQLVNAVFWFCVTSGSVET